MNERYQKLNTYYKTGIWTLGIDIIVILPLIPLFFVDMFDIPLGILLGAIFSATFYFLIGYNQRDKYSRKALNIDIFLIILRFFLFAIAIVGLALLYYLANIRIFNIFGFAGAYLFGLLVHLFLSRQEGMQ